MGQWNLDREYQRLLEEGLAAGDVMIRADGPDHRATPRLRLCGGHVAVRVEPEVRVVDLSASGIAFLSDRTFHPGDMLQVILRGTLAFQVKVLGCAMEETNADLLEVCYRVRCRFHDVTNGKHLLVLLKEMERGNAAVSGD
ncbi:MAG TPA: PilZ domain-containing protein [bacterium]|nr:PilZ domain-containing protein [bacterium]